MTRQGDRPATLENPSRFPPLTSWASHRVTLPRSVGVSVEVDARDETPAPACRRARALSREIRVAASKREPCASLASYRDSPRARLSRTPEAAFACFGSACKRVALLARRPVASRCRRRIAAWFELAELVGELTYGVRVACRRRFRLRSRVLSRPWSLVDRYSAARTGFGADVSGDLGRSSGDRSRGFRTFVRALAGSALMLVVLGIPAARADAAPALKLVRYHGYGITVPVSWPVFRLTRRSTVCVRFNRHAVYLGSPGDQQRCPAHAAGRTEAILAQPLGVSEARLRSAQARALAPVTVSAAQLERGSGVRIVLARHGLEVTATWNRDPEVVRRALGVGIRGGRVASAARLAPRAVPASAGHSVAHAGAVFTGLGVDACSAPSSAQMAAWNASPYRALGVYIGGANMACSQPNLTASWVGQEWAAGWHLIPTYVGLQAPSNSCACAAIVPSQASVQGTAAASDAVTQAQAVGIGAGNPIYFDMEGYSRTAANTSAVLAFLSAWTTQLHAEGYTSGVYSSGASGVQDLVSQYGTGYAEPDDVWIANWNGSPTTNDPYLPSDDWPAHQRLHQYNGAHNETYGGVTINVDSDALDGATASEVPAPASAPSLRVSPAGDGTARLFARWQDAVGVVAWRTLGGATPTALQPIGQTPSAGAVTTIAASSAFAYYAVQALDSGDQVLGSSAAVATPAHLAIYGHSAFVPARGLVGIPVGCFTGRPCRISLMVYAGRRRIARSGPEQLSSQGGLLFFKLSASDRKLLAQAPRRRLAVTVRARDASGVSSAMAMNLIPFLTTGPGPRRSLGQAGRLRLVGVNDFVFRRAVGGILAACSGPAPCLVRTTIIAAHRTIASTGVEFLGANQIGYLSFRLAPFGRALLARTAGNQLGASVTITDGTSTARGSIALSGFR